MNDDDPYAFLDGEVKAPSAGELKILPLLLFMTASSSSKRSRESSERHPRPKMIGKRRSCRRCVVIGKVMGVEVTYRVDVGGHLRLGHGWSAFTRLRF